MGARRVEFHEGARADIKAAVSWYRDRSPKAARDFVEELDRAIETIRKAPKRWPVALRDTRRFLLWRFPFTIVYSVGEPTITIWAVAHGSKKPGYWSDRS